MVILGIDPGFGRVGYGIISYTKDKYKVIEYGCITTPENSYFPQRLNKIEEDLESILSRYNDIDVASIEDLYFNTNITTGIKVAQARGVIINTIYRPYIIVEPNGILIYDVLQRIVDTIKEGTVLDVCKKLAQLSEGLDYQVDRT